MFGVCALSTEVGLSIVRELSIQFGTSDENFWDFAQTFAIWDSSFRFTDLWMSSEMGSAPGLRNQSFPAFGRSVFFFYFRPFFVEQGSCRPPYQSILEETQAPFIRR